jgi:DNA polymerase-3 subunit epsilon
MKDHLSRVVVIDCETSGLDYWSNSIIELACLVVDEDLQIIGEFCERAQPESWSKWSEKSEAVHGITPGSLRSANCQHQLARNFSRFIAHYKVDGSAAFKWVDHANGRFDYRFVKAMFTKQGGYYHFYKYFNDNEDFYATTIKLARQSRFYYPNYRLSTLCEHHDIPLVHHEALSDARGCFQRSKIYQNELV